MDDVLKRLGVEKFEDIETIVKTHRDHDQQLQQAQASAGEWKTKYEEQVTKEAQRQRTEALKGAAEKANAFNGQNIVDWAAKELPEQFQALFDDKGQVNAEKLAALVQDAKKANPHFFKSGPGSLSHANGRMTGNDHDKAARDANFARARRGH